MDSQRVLMTVAGINGALAVIFGAFGAHGLESRLDAAMLATYNTGVLYHLIHAAALVGLVFAPERLWRGPWMARAGSAWLAGVVVFSGSLYVLAVTGITALGAITPIGGLAFILGWVFLVPAARAGGIQP